MIFHFLENECFNSHILKYDSLLSRNCQLHETSFNVTSSYAHYADITRPNICLVNTYNYVSKTIISVMIATPLAALQADLQSIQTVTLAAIFLATHQGRHYALSKNGREEKPRLENGRGSHIEENLCIRMGGDFKQKKNLFQRMGGDFKLKKKL